MFLCREEGNCDGHAMLRATSYTRRLPLAPNKQRCLPRSSQDVVDNSSNGSPSKPHVEDTSTLTADSR
jgi:hypothetical protein